MKTRFKKTMAFILSSAMAITGGISIPQKITVKASESTDITPKEDSAYLTTEKYASVNPYSLFIKKGEELEFTFTVTASDANIGDNFPAFTATLKSMGGFWGWDKYTEDDDSWRVHVTAPGEYTIHVTAPADWDFSGAFLVDTDLTQLPKDLPCTILGKSAKLGNKTYDWHQAEAYKDGETLRLGIWNEWGKDENGSWDTTGNPLREIKSTKKIESERITVSTANIGDYILKGTFTQDTDSDTDLLILNTTLKTMPANRVMIGKTVKINGKEYDWSKAKTHTSNPVSLFLWDNQSENEWANPITEHISITAGEEIEVTFSVIERDPYSFTPKLTYAHLDDPDHVSYPESYFTALTGAETTWISGDYTLKGTAQCDASTTDTSMQLCLDTGLEELPKGYTIVGKSIKINGKSYDWSRAGAYKNLNSSVYNYKNICVYISNGDWDRWGYSNFLDEDISIKAGDEIEVTFTIKEVDASISTPTNSTNYIPDSFSMTLTSDNSIWKTETPLPKLHSTAANLSIKKGDALEFTFTVQELDDTSETSFPAFTATLRSLGGFWGWDNDTGDDDSWKVSVNAPGEYTIKVTAPADWDFSGAFAVDTNLKELPEGYTIAGKTAKLGNNIYNWQLAKAYKDSDTLRLSIWNEWAKDENGNLHSLANPLGYEYTEDWMAEDWVEKKAWTTRAYKLGNYTLKAAATQDATSRSGALSVKMVSSQILTIVDIFGKTVKIAGKEYDWSKARPYIRDNGTVVLSLWNAKDRNELANPLGEDIEIKAGDEIEVTFAILKKGTSLPTPIPTTTQAPTDTPVPNDTSAPADTPVPNDTPVPADTPNPIITSKPTDTSTPTDTSMPADTSAPTGTTSPISTQTPTKVPNVSKTPTPDNTQEPSPLAKNKTFTSGSLKYKVTATAMRKSPAKVTVIDLSPSGKKTASVNIKNKVTYSGISYQVTAIGNGAFRNSAKLAKATLGTNIRSISPNAFNGCKKLISVAALGTTKIKQNAFKNCKALRKLTFREKISVKRGAFKGCKKTIKVTGSSKKINKVNVKKLKKCGYKKFK